MVDLALINAPIAQKLLILLVKGYVELGRMHSAEFFNLGRC